MGVFDKKDQQETTVDIETATHQYEQWCKGWKMGRKKKNFKGEALEESELQEKHIIDLMMEGLLTYEEDNTLIYILEDDYEKDIPFESLVIKRPKGAQLMEIDRFKEQQGMHKAYAMVSSAVRKPEKTIQKLEYNTDITNLMAVIGHFLTV